MDWKATAERERKLGAETSQLISSDPGCCQDKIPTAKDNHSLVADQDTAPEESQRMILLGRLRHFSSYIVKTCLRM